MKKGGTYRTIIARLTALCLALFLVPATGLAVAEAAGGTRTLKLYFAHTGESGTFTFRKNGRYDTAVLKDLNHFLRDWRRNEDAKMDPALFDLIWEVYQSVDATQPITVVSAYRSPTTNEMLRSKSGAVAKNSRHIQGKAMDFYIPGVPLSKLRAAAMKKQVGGVGYYPSSGSPFVHLDTGNVRAWPRMTKAQLQKLFPDGKTLHLPSGSDTPLSQSGYQLARAEWNKCHSIPCTGLSTTTSFAVAQNDSTPGAGNGKTLMDWLFGNDEADEAAADGQGQGPVVVATATTVPPVPAARPASLYDQAPDLPFGTGSDPLVADASAPDPTAPIPQAVPTWRTETDDAGSAVFTVASINPGAIAAPTPEPQPLPNAPSTAPSPLPAPFVAAYAPTAAPEPDAQRALQMILERRAAADGKVPADLNTTGSHSALTAAMPDTNALSALISGTMQAVISGAIAAQPPVPVVLDFEQRNPNLIAPDLAHVTDLLVDPAFVSSSRFAIIFNHEGGDFSPATELGNLAPEMTIGGDPTFGLGRTHFARGT